MRKLAHIINPFLADESSDLKSAQPITWQTMRIAKSFAENQNPDLKIEHWACVYLEDESEIAEGFKRTRDLEKSVLDYGRFESKTKYPLFREVLQRLYESTDAEYLIQTNVDIGLMPYFYLVVDKLIELGRRESPGWNIFCINKRIIPEEYLEVEQIPLMYTEVGTPHRGMDCFVYPRDLWPRFDLGDICLGIPWSESTFVLNAATYGKFKVFRKTHLTFHVGDPRVWAGLKEHRLHNTNEFGRILTLLFNRNSQLKEEPVICWFLQKLKLEIKGHYSPECQKLNERSWTQLKKFAIEYEGDPDAE